MNWDANQQTAVIGMAGGNVDLALGMELLFPRRVRNSTGSTMAKGTVVYINGVSGNTPTVDRAIATNDMSSAFTLGMTAESIANGATGWVATFGELTGIDLSAYTGGDTLYLSGVSAGLFTNVPQSAPIHYVRVGTVVKATTDGALVVNVINGYELNELHNVVIASLASGQILMSNASNYWYNVNPGFIPTASYPSLGSLAVLNSLSYYALDSRLSLGSLAVQNNLSYYALDSRLSLGSLAVQDTVNYYNLVSYPSLGSLAVLNTLSYYALDSRLSLGSLAVQDTVNFYNLVSYPSLGSLSVLNSLSYYALDSRLSLGSLAVQNVVNYNNLVSLPSLNGDYLRLDLTNTPLTGNTLNFNGSANKAVNIDRTTLTAGKNLSITAGGALLGGTDLAGGNLNLSSGIATGDRGSDITFLTATGGTSGTTDRTPTQKMVIKDSGKVGIGETNPVYPLTVNGVIYSNDQIQAGGQIFGNDISSSTTITAGTDITAGGNISATGTVTGSNLSGTNTGDQFMPVYGDGSDGFVNFNGSNTFTFATYDGGSTTYTLTRDVFAYTVDVGLGVILITAGYRIFSQTYISNYGLIHNKGANGSGTTGGAGGLGGFFKAGGNGATGLLAASAGANGTAQTTPTANTLVGGIGGKGGQGRQSTTTFTGGMITSANVTVPADADGGNKVQSNYINYLTRYVVGATNWQMTPSIGGGSGAKSTTGTTATSGGGGGGGGIVFLASPIIEGSGPISANGGNGGNAAGTGGNFGGGGGGGGGIVCYIARDTTNLTQTPTATGGTGGTSVIGTNGTLPVATANGTTTTATQTMTITPTVPLTKGNLYFVTFHLQKTGGIGGSGINSMSGFGMSWTNLNTRVEFNSIASPTRVIETWYGYYTGTEPDIIDDETITVNLSDLNTTARAIIDEIQNTDASNLINPVTANTATNSVDSALTLTVTLPNALSTGNLVYSVFAHTVVTGLAAGAGAVLVNNQTTAPNLSSQVSQSQATTQTHTTTNGAIAGLSVEITKSSAGKNGSNGWDGKVVRIYG